ncbi:hypothetical protein EAS62_28430 [Bradyrhizobium zhanjiangense]|uniref:Uncharacterized protein n=1 Tax=Bradyrhizobium zhanjiangense TaxID=1325107 RepID=A0ABY0DE98_9BRAD|nr:hypothetical protein EAS62_28430 [Bradyrhizobium zhanjiangense]
MSCPATRLRQGFAGVKVQGRRSFSEGGRRGIQYAAASVATARYPTHASGILDRPVEPGDDSGGCGCDVELTRLEPALPVSRPKTVGPTASIGRTPCRSSCNPPSAASKPSSCASCRWSSRRCASTGSSRRSS